MNKQQKFLGGIILGVAVGSAILYLTKSKNGKGILCDIGDSAEDLTDNLKNKYDDVSDSFKDKFESVEKDLKGLIKKGKAFIEDFEDKAKKLSKAFK